MIALFFRRHHRKKSKNRVGYEISGLDLFLRAQEKRTFQKIAAVIGVATKAELIEKLTAWSEKSSQQVSWLFRYGDISLEGLAGLEKLDTVG